METEIIPLAQHSKWNEVVMLASNYDFYHLSSYHFLDQVGDPFLIKVSDGKKFIAIPLIKRSIDDTEYFDCTSAYGYAGPITNLNDDDQKLDLIRFFHTELANFCAAENIISVFSRLHPLLLQEPLLESLGSIETLNKTVTIDLRRTLDEQRKQYRKSTKSEVNQLRRKGYEIRVASADEQVQTFASIYTETMLRVEATKNYFFEFDYFHKFLQAPDFSSKLLLAYKDDVMTAGAIFTETKNFMQYHLAGTRAEFMKDTPMKLIIDEARIQGTNTGLSYLHLGGGVGGVNDDPLFRFKSGFSDIYFLFKVWKYVVNDSIYKTLSEQKAAIKPLNSSHFPLYRG